MWKGCERTVFGCLFSGLCFACLGHEACCRSRLSEASHRGILLGVGSNPAAVRAFRMGSFTAPWHVCGRFWLGHYFRLLHGIWRCGILVWDPASQRAQTCHGAVKEPMRNARTAAGFEPTPSKMPLCEASESLERQQASCPRHAKHKPEKRQPKTVRSQPFHMVPKLLATDPKRPNATTSRARASQKRCVRNPSTRCRNCSFEAVKKNTGKGP